MILQKIQLNNRDLLGTQDLYYRIDGDYSNEKILVLMSGSKLNTSTYFNSFSLGKWRKYTVIENVYLQLYAEGSFRVRIYHSKLEQETVQNSIIEDNYYKLNKPTEIKIKLPVQEDSGEYYFTIEAKKQTKVYEACYKTSTQPKKIGIAIAICTFHRENMVKNCINRLIEDIFNNESSRVRDYLQVYIIDNGQTLESNMGHRSVRVISNKNYGGSGGFTRGIIAALENEADLTHVLLMDDDAIVNSETVEMTYALLSLLKPMYEEYVVGGGLLRQDIPYLQYELGAKWKEGKITALKHNLDLREYKNVLFNNMHEDVIDYNGWWYCCIPLKKIKKIGLPLPIFIHRDDIEYGIRIKHQFIHLNGISVWHEAFENKMQGVLDYYEMRNLAIIYAIHTCNPNPKLIKNIFLKQCLKAIYKNEYKNVHYNIKAIQDFCNGIDCFKILDPEYVHQELLNNNYKRVEIKELQKTYLMLADYKYNVNIKQYDPSNKSRVRGNILSTFLFNGMLLPLRRKPVILQSNMPMYYNFAAKITIHTDIGEKAFITQHSYDEILRALKGMRKTCKLINEQFEKSSKEYYDRYGELINIDFWKEYLKS